jgi:hypothetical protein
VTRYFHRTSAAAAGAIRLGGFQDGTGHYLTENLHTGVWLSDRPLDGNEGADGDVLLAIDAPPMAIDPFEWVEEGKTFREFLVPAAILNRCAMVTTVEE